MAERVGRGTPEAIARERAHERRRPGACAHDDAQATPRPPCDCRPDSDDLAAVWFGRARMAWARFDAGQPLDADDKQAIARYPREDGGTFGARS
jgi:hypothetical protein